MRLPGATLQRLILDGRIHPAHIEKVLAEEQREVDKAIVEAGEQAAFEAGRRRAAS